MTNLEDLHKKIGDAHEGLRRQLMDIEAQNSVIENYFATIFDSDIPKEKRIELTDYINKYRIQYNQSKERMEVVVKASKAISLKKVNEITMEDVLEIKKMVDSLEK